MRKLIVTGDDFGASTEVNEAIEQAHRSGILNTTCLMVGAPAADDAVRRAQRMPLLHVGLHVVLTDGHPKLDPSEILALVNENGEFSKRLVRAGFSFFFRPAARRQLEAEIRAQFDAFRATGLPLDHVNGHNHMHIHPTILNAILKLGREYGMRAVRLPREPFLPSWRAERNNLAGRFGGAVFLAPLIYLMKARLRRAAMACNDFLFGIIDTGHMTTQRVLRLLPHLPQGVSEIHFHPAVRVWPGTVANYEPEEELAALTNPEIIRELRASDIVITTFSDLATAQ